MKQIFNDNIRKFLGLLSYHAGEDAVCVSGSSVLRYYQGDRSSGNDVGDIDVYLHMRPRDLENYLWYGTRSLVGPPYQFNENNDAELIIHTVLSSLKEHYKIDYSDWKRWNTGPLDTPDEYGQYDWLRVQFGIVSFFMFKLHPLGDSRDEVKSLDLQIMVVNDFPPDASKPFFHRLLSNYDINVCQVYIIPTMGHAHDPNKKYEVKALDGNNTIFTYIRNKKMTFTFRPYQPFDVAHPRLRKYQKRGFHLQSVIFDPALSQEWKECLYARANFANKDILLHSLLFDRGFIRYKGAQDIVKSHISSFIGLPPDIDEIEERVKQEQLLNRSEERAEEIAPYLRLNFLAQLEEEHIIPNPFLFDD